MANLYILPDSWLIALTLWTFFSQAAESFFSKYQAETGGRGAAPAASPDF